MMDEKERDIVIGMQNFVSTCEMIRVKIANKEVILMSQFCSNY